MSRKYFRSLIALISIYCSLMPNALAGPSSAGPALSGTMVFAASQGDNWDLFAWYGGARKELLKLTDTPYDEKSPTLSPGGRKLAYVTTGGQLVLRDLETGEEEFIELTEFPGRWDFPSFSPDGRYLAGSYFEPGERDRARIAVLDLASKEIRFPVDQFGPQFDPAWAPTGSRVVFGYAHCSTACGHIIQEPWLMDVTQGRARQLLMTNSNVSGFSWNPDGNRIAFTADINGSFDIWLLDIEAVKLTRMTDYPGLDESPVFGPEGRQIAFVSNRSGARGIWIKDLRTDAVLQFAPLGDDGTVSYRDIDWK